MAAHNELGKKGEELARNFLESNGYVVIEQNWKFGKLEIDLIALKNNTVVIVEVKTRKTKIEDINELMSRAKEQHLLDATNAYMEEKNDSRECRIDLILIHTNSSQPEIIHIENAISQA